MHPAADARADPAIQPKPYLDKRIESRSNRLESSRYADVDKDHRRFILVACVGDAYADVDEVVDHLGSREEIRTIETILEKGTSADRQLRVYEETGSLEAVVDSVLEETMLGVR